MSESTREGRHAWRDKVVAAYGADESGYTDLIADLMLLAHVQGLDAEKIQRMATDHYEAENDAIPDDCHGYDFDTFKFLYFTTAPGELARQCFDELSKVEAPEEKAALARNQTLDHLVRVWQSEHPAGGIKK